MIGQLLPTLQSHFIQYILQQWLISLRVRGRIVDVEVYPKALKSVLILLKTLSFFNYDCLMDIIVTDNLFTGQQSKNRYRITYTLVSYIHNARINVHCSVATNEVSALTITDIFSNADWLEREVWDMFGVHFIGHGDLRRILTDYQFEGFPLRKDFPVIGFIELFYYDAEARIIYLPIALAQQIKQYNAITSTWVSEWN